MKGESRLHGRSQGGAAALAGGGVRFQLLLFRESQRGPRPREERDGAALRKLTGGVSRQSPDPKKSWGPPPMAGEPTEHPVKGLQPPPSF